MRTDYAFIHAMEKWGKELGKTKAEIDNALVETKQRVRHANKFSQMDERTKKVFIPDELGESYSALLDYSGWNKEDAEDHFMANYYIPRFYSQYDCTGKPFTCYYKFVHIGDNLHILHHVALDI